MERKRNTTLKIALVVLTAVALLTSVAGLTYAALKDTTAVVNNTLDPAHVTCEVVENFDGNVKSSVKVKNTGDIPALLRVKVVINWIDGDGNVVYSPGGDYHYSVTLADPLNWTNDGGSTVVTSGYWYYNGIVQPDELTTDLIATAYENLSGAAASDPSYHLRITVMAEALQAAPGLAAQDVWGMTYANGSWTSV